MTKERAQIDEDVVKEAPGCDNVLDAVRQEAGWMHDSGIFVESIEQTEELEYEDR